MSIINMFPGGGMPSSWVEKVTAPALENITKGQAVEYRMYPGEDVFNYSSQNIGSGTLLAFSSDMNFAAVVNGTTPTTIEIYRLVLGAYSKIQDITVASYNNSLIWAALSGDGQILVIATIASGSTVTLRSYKFNGSTYVAAGTTPTVSYISTMASGGVLISEDGKYVAIGGKANSSTDVPLAYAFEVDLTTAGLTPLTISNVFVETSREVTSFACDAFMNYVIHGASSNSSVCLYKRTGSSFARITQPFSGTGAAGAISYTGKYFATGTLYSTGKYTKLYRIVGDALVDVTLDAAQLPTAVPTAYAFSPDEKYLFVFTATSPYIWILKIDPVTHGLTKLANPASLPTGAGTRPTCRADGKLIAFSRGAPNIVMYNTGAGGYMLPLRDLATGRYLALNQYSNYKLGVADATVEAGQPCTATMFKVLNEVIT